MKHIYIVASLCCSMCCSIYCIYCAIFTSFYQCWHIVTDAIKNKLMNLLNIVNWWRLLEESNDITIFVSTYHRPIYTLYNRLVAWLLLWRNITGWFLNPLFLENNYMIICLDLFISIGAISRFDIKLMSSALFPEETWM